MTELIHRANDEHPFDFVTEKVCVKAWGKDTNGAYSLMRWSAGPLSIAPPHVHCRYEETFFVLSGHVSFLLGRDTVPLFAGDFVRVPPGVRHAYQNMTENSAEMLVGFIPGGMEELFYKFRGAAHEFDLQSFLADAREIHDTEYELGRRQ